MRICEDVLKTIGSFSVRLYENVQVEKLSRLFWEKRSCHSIFLSFLPAGNLFPRALQVLLTFKAWSDGSCSGLFLGRSSSPSGSCSVTVTQTKAVSGDKLASPFELAGSLLSLGLLFVKSNWPG